MEAIFLSLLNTSVSASWLILAVIILRQILQKTPKWIICLLWAVVAFRLLCPISIESPIAVIPESNITQELVDANIPGIAIPQFDTAPVVQNMDLIHVQIPTREVSSTEIATMVWIVGVFCMMIYLLISYLRLHYQVREAAILFGNIWLCDAVRSPFILGIIKQIAFRQRTGRNYPYNVTLNNALCFLGVGELLTDSHLVPVFNELFYV